MGIIVHPVVLTIALVSALGTTAMPRHSTRGQVSSVTAMSSDQLSALTPYTQFARAAYCSPSVLQGWACGGMSFALRIVFHHLTPFKRPARLSQISMSPLQVVTVTLSSIVRVILPSLLRLPSPRDYVGYSPSLNTVLVAHQGTDPTRL